MTRFEKKLITFISGILIKTPQNKKKNRVVDPRSNTYMLCICVFGSELGSVAA
jgi:hypothetical protein